MKKHLKTLINTPALVAGISVVIAAAVGTVAYMDANKAPATETIAEVNATSTAQSLSLGFLVGGRIDSVSVKVNDHVTKGETLASLDPESALGALTQAQAAYASAKASYDKLINGASDSTIEISKSAVTAAQQNLNNLLQSSYTQVDTNITSSADVFYTDPNSYSPGFRVSFVDSVTGNNVTYNLVDENQTLKLNSERVQIGTLLAAWNANPNIDEPTTLSNLNAIKSYLADVSAALGSITYDVKYESVFDGYKANLSASRDSIDTLINNIQNAQKALDTANANVASVTSAARPEDIAAAKAQVDSAYGAVQIAQSSFDGRVIVAPEDATVTAVYITPGEIALPNSPAIDISN